MALDKKKLFILVPIALVFLFALVEGARVWWFRGYSKGSRTGVVRKVSIKGPPYCKYFSGELALQGGQPGQPPEIWEFSIDGSDSAAERGREVRRARHAQLPAGSPLAVPLHAVGVLRQRRVQVSRRL
jgi:hypothetical protein